MFEPKQWESFDKWALEKARHIKKVCPDYSENLESALAWQLLIRLTDFRLKPSEKAGEELYNLARFIEETIEDGGFLLWRKGRLNWLRNQAYSIRTELASLLWNSA